MLFKVTTEKLIAFLEAHTYYEGRHFLVQKFPGKPYDLRVVNDEIEEIIKAYPEAKLIEVPHIRSMDSISHGERDRIYEATKAIPFQEKYSSIRYRK